jgi:L-asparaginase
MSQRPAVLLIYTGGTIGMWADTARGTAPHGPCPFGGPGPELERIAVDLSSVAFEQPIDSSDMRPNDWVRIATLIGENYDGLRWLRRTAW